MKKRKYLLLVGILPVALLATLYAGGYLAQLIGNYQTWRAAGGFAGNGTAPLFPSAAVSDCFRAVFWMPYGLYGIGICALLLLLLFAFVMKLGFSEGGDYDRERNLIFSHKGTYGTAGFMTENEMHEHLQVGDVKDCTGIILGEVAGKVVALPDDTRFNKNIAVYGSSGSMKSRAYIRNHALQLIKLGQSFYLTDPKSELYTDLAEYARSQGYCVRVLNLVHPENSDSWNCLGEVEGSELMAQIFADVVIKNTGSERGDHFWDNGELNLLKALILYVDQGPAGTQKTIAEVIRLLTIQDETALNKIFDLLPISHPAKAPYNIYKQASDTVRTGIIIGLGTRLQVLQNKLIQEITSHDGIDLTLPGKQKCAYFCIVSDQDSTFDFISSLFFSFIFIKLVRFADQHGIDGKLPVPVTIIGEEWPNIGTVPDLPKKISTIRSRALSLVCCFQNLPQLQNRYPLNQWQEILGNCDTTVFLGCTDPLTAQFVADRAGEASVAVDSKSKQLGTWRISNYTPEYRETASVGKRKLLTMDEVMRLPMDQALIFLRGQKVLKVKKFDFSRHPAAKKLVKSKATEHVPECAQPKAEVVHPVEAQPQPSQPKTRPSPKPKPPKAVKIPKVDASTGEVLSDPPVTEPVQQAPQTVNKMRREDILS